MAKLKVGLFTSVGEYGTWSNDENLDPLTMDSARRLAVRLLKKYGLTQVADIYNGRQIAGVVRYIVPGFYYISWGSKSNGWYPIKRDGSLRKDDVRYISNAELGSINEFCNKKRYRR